MFKWGAGRPPWLEERPAFLHVIWGPTSFTTQVWVKQKPVYTGAWPRRARVDTKFFSPREALRPKFHLEGTFFLQTRAQVPECHLQPRRTLSRAKNPHASSLLGQGRGREPTRKRRARRHVRPIPCPTEILHPKPASQFLLGSAPTQREPCVRDRVLRHMRF